MDEHTRKLNPAEISALIKKADAKTVSVEPKHSIADEIWKKNARKFLRLFDGEVQTVTVNKHVFALGRRKGDKVFIRNEMGFVPCGWFTRKWFEDRILDERA